VRLYASVPRGVHALASKLWCRNVSVQKILSKAEQNPNPAVAAAAAVAAAGASDAAAAAAAAAGGVEAGQVAAAAAAAAVAGGSKPAQQARQCLFHDDTMPSFFRRPAWSPCGSFLAVPAGIYRWGNCHSLPHISPV